MTKVRLIPAQVLIEYEKHGSFSEETLSKLLDESGLEQRDKALASEIAYGTLEKLYTINFYLDQLLPKGVKSLAPLVRAILQSAVYQIQYLNRVPDFAVVDEAVKLAAKKAPYAKQLINGVLRNFLREKDRLSLPTGQDIASLSIRYSISQEILALLISQYGEQAALFWEGFSERPHTFLFWNTFRNAAASPNTHDLQATATPNSFLSKENLLTTEAFAKGDFFVQGRSSTFAAHALQCKAGERILDMCGAPGGKSFAAAIFAKDEASITTFDVNIEKIEKIKQGAIRLGLSSVQVQIGDGSIYNPAYANTADKIICDVPCSGLGILAKKPEIRYKQAKDFKDLPSIQLQILKNAFLYLKEDGELLYSTCTWNKNENQDVIRQFLASESKCKVVSLSTMAQEQEFQFLEEDGMLTILPNANQDGFFVTKLVRIS